MLCELLNWNAISFVHLHALDQEEASLDRDWLWNRQFVPPVVNLVDKVFHFKTVEGRVADHHLVKHHTKCPRVYFLVVAALFQKLRTRVERRSTNTEVRVRSVKNR